MRISRTTVDRVEEVFLDGLGLIEDQCHLSAVIGMVTFGATCFVGGEEFDLGAEFGDDVVKGDKGEEFAEFLVRAGTEIADMNFCLELSLLERRRCYDHSISHPSDGEPGREGGDENFIFTGAVRSGEDEFVWVLVVNGSFDSKISAVNFKVTGRAHEFLELPAIRFEFRFEEK